MRIAYAVRTYVCTSPKTQVHYVYEGVGLEVGGEVVLRVWFCVVMVQLGTKPLLCVCATNHAHHERTILVAKDDHDDPSVDIVVEPQSQPESLQSPGQVQ